jgi:hypothetical protein
MEEVDVKGNDGGEVKVELDPAAPATTADAPATTAPASTASLASASAAPKPGIHEGIWGAPRK